MLLVIYCNRLHPNLDWTGLYDFARRSTEPLTDRRKELWERRNLIICKSATHLLSLSLAQSSKWTDLDLFETNKDSTLKEYRTVLSSCDKLQGAYQYQDPFVDLSDMLMHMQSQLRSWSSAQAWPLLLNRFLLQMQLWDKFENFRLCSY